MSRITPHAELAAALESATLVQETGPENPEIKQSMFADFESFTGADTLLVSSTSGIPPAVIGQRMQNPARVMIGHPFNPPHKIPLVEVCAADVDNAEPVKRLMAFYESCDRVPVLLRKPVPGFVVNRLQSAMLREAIQLVSEGVVDVKGMDDIVLNSIGIRLASIGPMLVTHLGSQGGLTEMIDKILAGLFAAMGLPPVDERTLALLKEQADQFYPLDRIDEFASVRDARQDAIVAIQSRIPLPDMK